MKRSVAMASTLAVGVTLGTAALAGTVLSDTLTIWATAPDAGGISYASSADYDLGGTAGQIDANEPYTMSGGDWTLNGGFWTATTISFCDGDANNDRVVDFADILIVLRDWGDCEPPPTKCQGDVTGNGVVDFADINMILVNWGCGGPEFFRPLRETLEEAGLTQANWQDFLDVMEVGTEYERENWRCWFEQYLGQLDGSFVGYECPDSDPFLENQVP